MYMYSIVHIGAKHIWIYIYIYIYSLCQNMPTVQCSPASNKMLNFCYSNSKGNGQYVYSVQCTSCICNNDIQQSINFKTRTNQQKQTNMAAFSIYYIMESKCKQYFVFSLNFICATTAEFSTIITIGIGYAMLHEQRICGDA